MSRNNHDIKLSKDEIDKYIDNIIEKNMVFIGLNTYIYYEI